MNNIRVAVTPKHCRPCDVEQKLINPLSNPEIWVGMPTEREIRLCEDGISVAVTMGKLAGCFAVLSLLRREQTPIRVDLRPRHASDFDILRLNVDDHLLLDTYVPRACHSVREVIMAVRSGHDRLPWQKEFCLNGCHRSRTFSLQI